MDNALKFLTLALLATGGIAGCSKDEPPDRTPTSDSTVGGQQVAGDTPSKDIFRIYDEFIAADAVAKKCGVSSVELEEQHKQNFMVIAQAVRNDLVSKHGRPEAALDEFLRGHDELIRNRTLQIMDSHPCDSADAKVVIERYRAQSRWKI